MRKTGGAFHLGYHLSRNTRKGRNSQMGRGMEVGRWGEGKRESGGKGEGEIKTEKRNEVRVNAVSSLLSGLFPTITSIPPEKCQ